MILLCNINKLKLHFNLQNNSELKDKILLFSNLNILLSNNFLSISSKYSIYLENVISEPDIDKFLNKMFDIVNEKHRKINQDTFDLNQFYILLPFHLLSKKIQNIIFIMKNFNDLPNDKPIQPKHILSILEDIIVLGNDNFSLSLKNIKHFLNKVIVFDLNEYFSTDFYRKMIFGYKMYRIRILIEENVKICQKSNDNIISIITYTFNNLHYHND